MESQPTTPIYDILPWYRSLKIVPGFTDQEMQEKKIWNPDYLSEYKKLDISALHKNCHGTVGDIVTDLQIGKFAGLSGSFYLFKLDNLYDLTYDWYITVASPGNCGSIKLYVNDIKVYSALWNNHNQRYEFPDFTVDNPFFMSEPQLTGINRHIRIDGLWAPIETVKLHQKCVHLEPAACPSGNLLRLSALTHIPSQNKYIFESYIHKAFGIYDPRQINMQKLPNYLYDYLTDSEEDESDEFIETNLTVTI